MVTKEQERQSIKKIQAIIEGLGANSYIAAAMEGVLELDRRRRKRRRRCEGWRKRYFS